MANNTGKKFGGRKKGVPNKITTEIIEQLDDMECNPIEGLANLALESECEEMRFKALKELAQYVAPKRKAIDVSMNSDQTHEEWLEIMRNAREAG